LHLVGHFYKICIMMHRSMNVKLITAQHMLDAHITPNSLPTLFFSPHILVATSCSSGLIGSLISQITNHRPHQFSLLPGILELLDP